MSLIYDALKRAEDDNKRIAVGVRTSGRRTLLGKRRQQWMWALVGVLAVNAIVVTTLVLTLGPRWSGSRPAETEPRVAATPAPQPAAATTPQQAAPPSAVAPTPPPAAPRPTVATAAPQAVPPPAALTPAPQQMPPQSVAPRTAPVDAAPSARPAPAPVVTPQRTAPVESAPVAKAVKPLAPSVESPRVAAAPPATPAPAAPASRVAPAVPVTPAAPAAPAAAVAPPVSPAPPAPRVTPAPVESPRVVVRPREEPAAARVERPVPPPALARKSDARAEPEGSRRPAITGETATADEKAGGRPGPPPAITLQVLVYSDVPMERMVFIDGRRLAEGDSIDAETTLERINKDGIVVRRRGVRYVILSQRD